MLEVKGANIGVAPPAGDEIALDAVDVGDVGEAVGVGFGNLAGVHVEGERGIGDGAFVVVLAAGEEGAPEGFKVDAVPLGGAGGVLVDGNDGGARAGEGVEEVAVNAAAEEGEEGGDAGEAVETLRGEGAPEAGEDVGDTRVDFFVAREGGMSDDPMVYQATVLLEERGPGALVTQDECPPEKFVTEGGDGGETLEVFGAFLAAARADIVEGQGG